MPNKIDIEKEELQNSMHLKADKSLSSPEQTNQLISYTIHNISPRYLETEAKINIHNHMVNSFALSYPETDFKYLLKSQNTKFKQELVEYIKVHKLRPNDYLNFNFEIQFDFDSKELQLRASMSAPKSENFNHKKSIKKVFNDNVELRNELALLIEEIFGHYYS